MPNSKKFKTCAWCHKPTDLPEVFAAEVPILEWLEDKINKYCEENNISRNDLWGAESDWNRVKIPETFELELLTYDELVATVNRKTICRNCLEEDQRLWSKYYLNNDDDLDLDLFIEN